MLAARSRGHVLAIPLPAETFKRFLRHFRGLVAAAALAAGLSAASPAGATTVAELTNNQLVDASELIVRGTVTEIWTELDADGKVWTRAQVAISDVLKGDHATRAVVVDQLGGTFGGTTTTMPGAVRFSVDEDVVLFLETLGSGHMVPVGLTQGKFTVRMDPYSRSSIVQRFTLPLQQEYDHRFLPLPSADGRVALADLESQVSHRVAEGWDGQPIPGASMERLARINETARGVK